MATRWFARWGWLHRPVSVAGWLATALAVAFCVHVFLAIDRHSHSASDTLYGMFPYLACVFQLFDWLASRSSRTGGHA
ncbi:MAG: hypothetical protein WKF61_08100 [Luteimonas sp.]